LERDINLLFLNSASRFTATSNFGSPAAIPVSNTGLTVTVVALLATARAQTAESLDLDGSGEDQDSGEELAQHCDVFVIGCCLKKRIS